MIAARTAALTLVAMAVAAAPASAVVPSGNLLANPGAETGGGCVNGKLFAPSPPGSWTRGPNSLLGRVSYGSDADFPTTATATAIGGGSCVFAGGSPNNVALTGTAFQTADVSADAAQIDAGRVAIRFGGYLSQQDPSGDSARIIVTFLASNNAQIGGPETLANGAGDSHTLNQVVGVARVPSGTRMIRFTMEASRTSAISSYIEAFFDNLELKLVSVPAPGDLAIDEFRFDGPGPNFRDDFLEVYNRSSNTFDVDLLQVEGPAITFTTQGGGELGPGRRLLYATGPLPGLLTPGYSLGGYGQPDIVPQAVEFLIPLGVRLRSLGTVIDAAGFATAPPDFREGAGLPPVLEGGQHSFVRRPANSKPKDSNDNAADFMFVGVNGDSFSGVPSVFGAPGPQSRISGFPDRLDVTSALVDPARSSSASPNREYVPGAGAGGFPGTLTIRRKLTNPPGGAQIQSLRLRIMDATVKNNRSATQSELRLQDSPAGIASTTAGTVPVAGLTVDDGVIAQPNGGGVNSSATVNLGGVLQPGQSINVAFVFKVDRSGAFTFSYKAEANEPSIIAARTR